MRQIRILLVEDNEGDILLTTEALEEGNVSGELIVVKDGWEAVQFLEKTGKYKAAKSPDIVFLDINIPKLNGLEVLQRIKNNNVIKHIPVIMLSSSSAKNDVLLSNRYNANFYINKPLEIANLKQVLNLVKEA
ncbi:MAG: response regulator [Chitinophagales bacterium]